MFMLYVARELVRHLRTAVVRIGTDKVVSTPILQRKALEIRNFGEVF
jgi:hypothetical protein